LSRTERGTIVFALFLLVFTVGEFCVYDYLFSIREHHNSTFAELAGSIGDVRVDSNAFGQSVFSGANSRASLRFGRSEIHLEENALVFIQKESGLDSLQLKYGSFSGSLTAGARLLLETEARQKFEIKGIEDSKIFIHRRSGNVVLKVIEGNIQFIESGRIQSLASRDEIQFSNQRKNEINPLVFLAPKFSVHYSHNDSEELEFSWRYSNREVGGPFLFEASGDPSFKTTWVSREAIEPKIAVAVHFPRVIYYRVKDGQGNYSEIRRLSLLRPNAPSIAFDSHFHRKSILNLKLTPESRATVQIAKDPYFQQVFITRSGVASNYGFELPAGKYFARARLEYRQFNYDFTPMVSPWSESKAFSIP
jgi:hypothetical protein